MVCCKFNYTNSLNKIPLCYNMLCKSLLLASDCWSFNCAFVFVFRVLDCSISNKDSAVCRFFCFNEPISFSDQFSFVHMILISFPIFVISWLSSCRINWSAFIYFVYFNCFWNFFGEIRMLYQELFRGILVNSFFSSRKY